MHHFQRQQQAIGFLISALECSVYISPAKPGLTYEELIEIGRRVDLQPGEISDVMSQVTTRHWGTLILPNPEKVIGWTFLNMIEEPEYRNIAALDFWSSSMTDSARANGTAHAKLDRDVTIERAAKRGISKHDMEVALAVELLCKHVVEIADVITLAGGRTMWPLASEQRQSSPLGRIVRNENRARAYPIVKDVIERRTDGRSRHAEPLDAFAEKLNSLGYGHFRAWWVQMVSELRRSDPEISAVSVCVLAAALVEGALTFAVRHGQSLNMGLFGSSKFKEDPRRWKIDDLVGSAASSGGDAAILDQVTRLRADTLVASRQRIHAGRMLAEFPGGIPDLRPEQGREAKATADLVVRAILDWLEKYPAG